MAEIKSTLDLVMERTRNLAMTDKEKRELSIAEFKKNLNGLLLKHLEGMSTLDRLAEDVRNLQETSGFSGKETIASEILKRLDPNEDAGPLLSLLDRLCGADPAGLASILDEHRNTIASRAADRALKLKAILAKTKGISGSAVKPNLDLDDDWAAEQRELRDACDHKIRKEAARLGIVA